MAVNKTWKVTYAFRDGNKKQAWSSDQIAYVLAADNKEDTIRSVLSSNGIAQPGATIDIKLVIMAPGDSSNVLS